MKGEDVGLRRWFGQRSVRVQNVSRLGNMKRDIVVAAPQLLWIKRHQVSLGHPRSGERQQRNLMAQLGQAARQPDHDSLRAAVPPGRQQTLNVQGDVHAAAMYWWPSALAIRAV
jgi:hypothetical protein